MSVQDREWDVLLWMEEELILRVKIWLEASSMMNNGLTSYMV